MPIIRCSEDNSIATMSWIKLDLTNYLGSEVCKVIPGLLYDETGKYVGVNTIYSYFECSKYGTIYIDLEDLLYIFQSAIKHGEIKTSRIIQKSINYCHNNGYNNIINLGDIKNDGTNRQIQAKAS